MRGPRYAPPAFSRAWRLAHLGRIGLRLLAVAAIAAGSTLVAPGVAASEEGESLAAPDVAVSEESESLHAVVTTEQQEPETEPGTVDGPGRSQAEPIGSLAASPPAHATAKGLPAEAPSLPATDNAAADGGAPPSERPAEATPEASGPAAPQPAATPAPAPATLEAQPEASGPAPDASGADVTEPATATAPPSPPTTTAPAPATPAAPAATDSPESAGRDEPVAPAGAPPTAETVRTLVAAELDAPQAVISTVSAALTSAARVIRQHTLPNPPRPVATEATARVAPLVPCDQSADAATVPDFLPADEAYRAPAVVTGVAVLTPRMTNAVAVAMDFARLSGGWAGPLVFNVWLRRQLRERRLTQRQLAAMSGVNHSTISRLVSGGRTPSLETAAKLVHALRLDWTDEQVATYFDLLPERTLFPSQRVESALRGDPDLDDADVQDLMTRYLAARSRRRTVDRLVRERSDGAETGDRQSGSSP